MTEFINTFGVLISAIIGMGTVIYQMKKVLGKVVDFYQFAVRAEVKLTSIDEKLTRHLKGHP